MSKAALAGIKSFVPLLPILNPPSLFWPQQVSDACFSYPPSPECKLQVCFFFLFLSHTLQLSGKQWGTQAGRAAVSNLFVSETIFRAEPGLGPSLAAADAIQPKLACAAACAAGQWGCDGPSSLRSSGRARRSSPNGHESLAISPHKCLCSCLVTCT